MSFFDLFRKKSETPSPINPQKELRSIIDYIPDIYKNQRQYINANEFLAHHEWRLTLESLIGLVDETEHYFSNEFWDRLFSLASQMNLMEIKQHCVEQKNRNELDLKSGIPSYGSTMVKYSDTLFQHYYAEKIKDKWITERHVKDNVKDLLKKDGAHLKMHGGVGTLYIVDRGRLAEIDLEMGMQGLLMYFKDMSYWYLPTKQLITEQERQAIKEMITTWALQSKNVIEFDDLL